MDDLSKIFKHLARDTYIYFIPGFVVAAYVIGTDLLAVGNLSRYTDSSAVAAASFVVFSFVTGHAVFALMYIAVECTQLDRFVRRAVYKFKDVDSAQAIRAFVEHRSAHEQYVERHTMLYLFRWNLAGALLVVGVIDLIQWLRHDATPFWPLSIPTVTAAVACYFLSLRTEKDCASRLDSVSSLPKEPS